MPYLQVQHLTNICNAKLALKKHSQFLPTVALKKKKNLQGYYLTNQYLTPVASRGLVTVSHLASHSLNF